MFDGKISDGSGFKGMDSFRKYSPAAKTSLTSLSYEAMIALICAAVVSLSENNGISIVFIKISFAAVEILRYFAKALAIWVICGIMVLY